MGTLVAVEIETTPGGGVEQPLDEEEPSLEGERERLVSLLSSIVTKRRRKEENPKQGSEWMQDGYQRKMKEIFIAEKRHGVTVTGIISITVHPLMRVALKIMHRAPVIQAGKQIVQLFRERYTETW
jgi:hypothetical protein